MSRKPGKKTENARNQVEARPYRLAEAAELRQLLEREPRAGCYSTCRTCEIGMSRAVGRPFRSILALVHETVARA